MKFLKLSDDINFPLHYISIDQRLLRMEETRLYRSRDVQLSINSSTLDESWEEQAFAVDTAGALGGCIWPPRSYSCSFCGREFRSAQALGGHMNVHRRDRARLKQSTSTQNEIVDPDEKTNENPIRNSFTSMSFQYPSPVCRLVYSPNPKTEICNSLSSLSSTSRVSATSTKDFCSERILFCPSMADEEEHEKKSPISWSQFRRTSPADPFCDEDERNRKIIDQEEKIGRRTVDSECKDKKNYIKADLSVNLTLVIRHPTPGISDQIEEAASWKRKRDDNESSTPIFNDKHEQSEVIGLSPTSIDGLDLELRLGGRPRMNRKTKWDTV